MSPGKHHMISNLYLVIETNNNFPDLTLMFKNKCKSVTVLHNLQNENVRGCNTESL